MYGLIKPLYNEEKQRLLESLYADSDAKTQLLIRSTIAEALKDCPNILESHGSDWILCTLASYHKSEDDTFRVYRAVMNMFDKMSFGLLTEDIKWRELNDVADTCLVGLSFFRKKMEEMSKRHAAPAPDYYRKTGSLAFQRIGFEDIGEDFDGWVNFIEKELTVTSFY